MVFAIIMALTITGFLCLQVLLAKQNDASHGSNTVTRFVRNGVANHAYRRVIFLSVLAFPLQLVIGLITKNVWTIIFLFIPIGLCAYFHYKSVNDQNMKDARVMTKSVGRIIQHALPAVVGIVIGIILCLTGVGALLGVPIMIGGVAISMVMSKVTGKCLDKMTDVDAPDITADDFKELNDVANVVVSKATQGAVNIDFNKKQNLSDDTFYQGCEVLGISTQGRSVDDISTEVLSYAAPAMIAELPDNMSTRDKACIVLSKLNKEMNICGKLS